MRHQKSLDLFTTGFDRWTSHISAFPVKAGTKPSSVKSKPVVAATELYHESHHEQHGAERTKTRIRLPFSGKTAAECPCLQRLVCDACPKVHVFPKRIRRHASAKAGFLHSVVVPRIGCVVVGGCSCSGGNFVCSTRSYRINEL